MKNFFRNIDTDQIKDQISDIKDQVQDIRFRKPWTMGRGTPSLVFVGLGAAAAVAGIVMYRNRKKMAGFCAQCGSDLMEKLERIPIKEKAGKVMDKMNGSLDPAESHLENYQPN